MRKINLTYALALEIVENMLFALIMLSILWNICVTAWVLFS